MMQTSRSQLFDDWAKNYDNSITSENDDFPFAGYEMILEKAVSLADVKPNMRVLDLGIGTGSLSSRFINKGCNVWGLDFSAEMLAQTREKLPQANLVQADLLGDWKKNLQLSFDRVVSSYVFHEFNLETKMGLLQKIFSKCLSPNGFVIVADIAFPDVDIRTAASQYWADYWDEDEYYWAMDETIIACEKIGLQVTYNQVSNCGGIFTFTNKSAG